MTSQLIYAEDERIAARRKAAQLTEDTGLVWQVEYRTSTARLHVVLNRLSLRHVEPTEA